MRVGLPTGVVEAGVDETITGLWTFANVLGFLTDNIGERTSDAGTTFADRLIAAHALGLITDDITERTTNAGVTIEGVNIRANALISRSLPLSSSAFLISRVVGDNTDRFAQEADGGMEWGPGNAARDTNLFRAAADELATDDDFNVGGALDLGGDIELSERQFTLTTGAKNNVGTGTVTLQRILLTTGVVNITGFSGGRAGRVIRVMNLGSSVLTLNDEDAGSTAANRMLFTGAADLALAERDVATFWYDGAILRWKLLSTTV